MSTMIRRKTILPHPKSGVLPMYSPKMVAAERHKIIMKALKSKKETPLSLGRHLILLSTLTKRTIPKASKVYKKNAKFVFGLKKM